MFGPLGGNRRGSSGDIEDKVATGSLNKGPCPRGHTPANISSHASLSDDIGRRTHKWSGGVTDFNAFLMKSVMATVLHQRCVEIITSMPINDRSRNSPRIF